MIGGCEYYGLVNDQGVQLAEVLIVQVKVYYGRRKVQKNLECKQTKEHIWPIWACT